MSNSLERALRRAVRDTDTTRFAILGNDSGVVDVPNTLDKVFIRYPESVDANGETIYSAPQIVNAGVNGAYLPSAGRGVRIGLDDYGELAVLRNDSRDLNGAGISARVVNSARPEARYVTLGQIQLFSTKPVATGTTSSTLVNVQPLFYDQENVIEIWRGTEVQADKLDLASFIPTLNAHRVVVVWLDTYTKVISATASTTQATTSPIDITDYEECFAQRPADSIPAGSYYLFNAQVTIDSRSIGLDMRQLINIPDPLGYKNPLDYKARVRPNRTMVIDTLSVTGTYGELEVLGELVAIG